MAQLDVLQCLGFILTVSLVAHCADDILVGCGGFVKSDVEIDYSLVEVSNYLTQQTAG